MFARFAHNENWMLCNDVKELYWLYSSLFFSFLANEFTITIGASQGNRIGHKDTHIQLLINCIYTLVLSRSPSISELPIPAGDIFFVFQNKNPAHEHISLECCSEHQRKNGGLPQIFRLTDTSNATIFKFKNTQWGIHWKIPQENTSSTLRLPIKFVCCSSDAENSNKYTRWAFHTFYTGQRSPFTLIPSLDSIKISHKITPQSLKITKSAENHEPLQKIVIKRKENEDWNFGDVPSASRNTGMSYDAILDALMKLSRQAEQLSTEVAQLIDSF